ncbi:MAG: hypothetical protein A4E57_00460 [Syntrophorhabdaceae bacterium PtaU1.Bin034]|jgi:hypothetical protein|nr:MAG: hypothetical protein A4E57_00460 [Syntrophorhabdaceae bacterium PtaU1.Bin034]
MTDMIVCAVSAAAANSEPAEPIEGSLLYRKDTADMESFGIPPG